MAGNERVGHLALARIADENSSEALDLSEEEKKLIELVAERIGRIIQRYKLLDELEADQKQKVMEIARLEGIVGGIPTPVSMSWYGAGPLKDSAKDEFHRCVERFRRQLDRILEEQVYKLENDVSDDVRSMAEDLGFMKAGPRDVIQIYLTALKEMTRNATRSKAGAYSEWGRILALELMGYLVSYYQKRAGSYRLVNETMGESQD
jgi:hypothetical protein